MAQAMVGDGSVQKIPNRMSKLIFVQKWPHFEFCELYRISYRITHTIDIIVFEIYYIIISTFLIQIS